MNQDSLFKPTPELMQEWLTKWKAKRATVPYDEFFATEAARWGADQELEACCEWISMHTTWDANRLQTARRPKQQSLKEQALLAIDTAVADGRLSPDVSNVVRRALESIPK